MRILALRFIAFFSLVFLAVLVALAIRSAFADMSHVTRIVWGNTIPSNVLLLTVGFTLWAVVVSFLIMLEVAIFLVALELLLNTGAEVADYGR